jgi:hypothetical protein
MSKKTELYIFSDGARKGDEAAVENVRKYAQAITGFKKVNLYFQEHNDLKKNVDLSRSIPLDQHGKIIRMEDDNVVSPFFLQFMNEALQIYRGRPEVLGVSGYAPPLGQNRYIDDEVYLSQFWSGWTWAGWIEKDIRNYLALNNPYADMLRRKIHNRVKASHPKLPKALRRMDEGLHEAGDQKLSYCMIRDGLFQIKPAFSLVKNIGHDGSGLHCGVSNKFDVDFYPKKVNPTVSHFDYFPVIDRKQYEFFHKRKNVLYRALNKGLRFVSRS